MPVTSPPESPVRDADAAAAPQRSTPPTQLLDLMKTALVLLDAAGTVVYVNTAGEHLFGVSAARLLGNDLSRALQKDALTPLVHQALTAQRPFVCRALRLCPRAPTSPESVVDCYVTPLEEDGRFSGLLLEIQDAEARLRFDRDAAQLVQLGASRNMVRQLAHEIKNPLGGLRGAAQLLERRLPESERDYTGVIMREADRLTTLVDSLLGPATHPRPQWLNVHEVLDDLERLVVAEAPPDVRVRTDYDPSLPQVVIDRDEVIQALLNLTRNALQSLGERGRLTLRTRAVSQVVIRGEKRSHMVRVDVEDDGPGVPDSLRDTLFYPLVTGRRDGTGIGLPTAQELIGRQRGSIEYESEPGHTVFSVYLPAEAPEG